MHDKVASQAFSFSCDINDPDSVLPCEKMLGAFDDDNRTLFADLEIHEKKCNYDGGLLTCAAVGGVAAKPEHRGKGAVKALFAHLFRESDYDVSILYPFSETYYRKLGYERVGRSVCAVVPFSELSDVQRNHDAVLYEGSDTEQLLSIYNKCARNYNLSFVRETADAFSIAPYSSGLYTYIRKNDAFATLSVDREKSTVFVREIGFDSCESMLGIIGFLRNFEGNQTKLCFQKIPERSPLLRCVRDLKNCDIQLHSTGAARILNTEKVLRSHKYPPGHGVFTIQVADEVFRVKYSENGVETEKNGVYAPDAVMGIHTASELLLTGFTDETFIPGLVIKNSDSDFFKAFPPKTTFFSDCF